VRSNINAHKLCIKKENLTVFLSASVACFQRVVVFLA
jgi:hypothetical protein